MFDFKREKQAIDQQQAELTQSALAQGVNRRRFLQGLGGLGVVAMLPMPVLASRSAPVRKLSLHSINTGEQVTASFWEEGRYLKEGLNTLNRIMRDYRAEEQSEIDPKLYDQLYLLQHRLGRVGEIQIISGYRSPNTNAMLRRTSRGVAKKSYHMKGQAIDLRLPGVPLAQVRQAALNMKVGGVGYYPSSNFVHLDTGPVRSWV